MTGTPAVHPIDGLTSVERLCQDIRHAIRSGQLVPGQELSPRRIAEQRQVRYETLAQLLVGLERDGLLVTRGDTAVVAPLDPAELTSVFALRQTVEMHLLERACARLDEAELQQLDMLVPHRVPRRRPVRSGGPCGSSTCASSTPRPAQWSCACCTTSTRPSGATTARASSRSDRPTGWCARRPCAGSWATTSSVTTS